MLDVSWGELIFVVGMGFVLIGKRDLPKAAGVAGKQVGRVVGLLQGARARADRFAVNSELKQLQNELRSGLRELDAVKSELAVSMSGGRELGSMTASANRVPVRHVPSTPLSSQFHAAASTNMASPQLPRAGSTPQAALQPSQLPPASGLPAGFEYTPQTTVQSSTIHQSSAAIAEQEWKTQGIAFTSAAERGAGLSSSSSSFDKETSGSSVLSNILQQSLVFDQYDRVVSEQDAALKQKVDKIQEKSENKTDT